MNSYKFIFIALILAFTSCKNKSADTPNVDLNELVLEEEVAATSKSTESSDAKESNVSNRKLIRTGTLVFESEDLLISSKFIKKLIAENKGYISSDQTTAYHHRIDQMMTLRIPNDRFDIVVDQITTHAKKTDSKNITSQDVSEEFIDVHARLHAKKEIEERYLLILSKAAKVEDILKVEAELGTIRTEIESIGGRLKWLENQTTLSTLNVTFYQTKEFSSETPFLNKLKSAFSGGWNLMVSFILGLIHIWPIILIIIIILFYLRKRFFK